MKQNHKNGTKKCAVYIISWLALLSGEGLERGEKIITHYLSTSITIVVMPLQIDSLFHRHFASL